MSPELTCSVSTTHGITPGNDSHNPLVTFPVNLFPCSWLFRESTSYAGCCPPRVTWWRLCQVFKDVDVSQEECGSCLEKVRDVTTCRLDQNILCHREMVQMRMDSFRNTTHRRTHGREKNNVTKKWLRNLLFPKFFLFVCFILVFTFSAFVLAFCIPFTLVLLLFKAIVSIMYKK